MTLNQRLIPLLLLGLTVTSGATTSLCVVSEDMTRCTCKIMVIHNPQDILICSWPLELELRDGKLDDFQMDTVFMDPTLLVQLVKLKKLIFNSVTVSFSFIGAVLPVLSVSEVNEINIISSTLEVVRPLQPPKLSGTSKIKALKLEDITVNPSLLQPSFHALHHWLFGSLESLGLVRSGLVEIDCYWAYKVENLRHLDLSENPISYTGLQSISSCSRLSFKYLKSLHLTRSSLTSLQSLCKPLSLAPALTQLDVSGNNLAIFHYPHCLQVKPLRLLNLSHSGITEVNSLLSTSLEELDLSYNYLEVFNNQLQSLKRLYLSNNHLIRLPSLDNLSHLQQLKVDSNQLNILIKEKDHLSTMEQLHSLHAGRNPYQCDCALKDTIIFLDNTHSVSVQDYPDDFLCATPAALQGTQIKSFSLEACVKPTSGTQDDGSSLHTTVSTGGTQDDGSSLHTTVSTGGTQDDGSSPYTTVSTGGTQDDGSSLHTTVSTGGTQDDGSSLHTTVSTGGTQDDGSSPYTMVSTGGTQDDGSSPYTMVSTGGTQDDGSSLHTTVSTGGTQDDGSSFYTTVSTGGTQDDGSSPHTMVSTGGTQDDGSSPYTTVSTGGTQDDGSSPYTTVSTGGTQDDGSSLYTTVSTGGTQDDGSSLHTTVSTGGTQDDGSPLCITLFVGLLSCLLYFC